MGFKLFSCAICGKEVSRRKSVWLKILDGRDGRACKDHPEIIKVFRDKFNAAQMQRDMEKLNKVLRVMAGIALVRVAYTLRGIPPEVIYFDLSRSGTPGDIISEIKKGVAEKGGPIMSESEVLDSMIAYLTATLSSQKD